MFCKLSFGNPKSGHVSFCKSRHQVKNQLPFFESPITKKVRELEESFLSALEKRDEDLVASFLDVRFRGVGVFGTVYDKGEFLSESFRKTEFRRVQLSSVRVTEEMGFANSITEVEVDVTLASSVIKGKLVITRTWVARGENWKMLSFHLTDSRLGQSWKNTSKAAK
ncbi:MAG: nuclear transport factor 2 family protein [Proteobacteria bacterium]|nr:MAG: nuclear transport factor 2 family protein [Pseudomonadota bacterium]